MSTATTKASATLADQPLSPLDGRYRGAVAGLSDYLSEAGLNRARVEVEVEWIITLTDRSLFGSAPLTAAQQEQLRALYRDFGQTEIDWLASTESVTRHDVKAVEYLVRDRLASLGISQSTAVGAPAELLSLIPEATPLDAAALGWQPDEVLARTTPAGTTYFAVVPAGLAPITALAAALLSDAPPVQAPDTESTTTTQVELPSDWPVEVPQALDLRSRAACASWGVPRAGVLDQLPLSGASLIDEPAAPAAVVVPRGRVTIVRVPGDRADSYVLVTDSGVAYPVADRTALGRLGFQPEQAKDVPTAVLSLLPRGPELSVDAARGTAVA